MTHVKSPEFKSYEVVRDKSKGYRVRLFWEYKDPDVVGFRIYKAPVSKPLLQKKYNISQKALEKLTHARNPKALSQILYDKNFFVENSKVKFNQSYESRFKVDEKTPRGLKYHDLAFIRTNPKGIYEFSDKNIKFGETNSYVISAFTNRLVETDPGNGVFVSVEDLTPPPSETDFVAEVTYSGVLLTFSARCCADIEGYKVYRRTVGTTKFEEIFEGPTTGQSSLLDTSLIPGNEYEYKLYLYDFFGNVSWSSVIKRVEFKSNLLNKGAIIDPIVQIRYENPNMIIEGRKNSKRIIGYRVERQDLWRNEKGFEIKSVKEAPWPNVVLFDEDHEMHLVDESAQLGRVYRYRVSSISDMGRIESMYISPPLNPGIDDAVQSRGFIVDDYIPPRVLSFEGDVKNRIQDPVYVKFSWNIVGDWEYLNIVGKNTRIKIDSIHDHIFFGGFEKGKSYNLRLEVFNLNNEMVTKSGDLRIVL